MRILEASKGVGGRVRTDVTSDGFCLDRGFQVLFTAYLALRRTVDQRALTRDPSTTGPPFPRDLLRHPSHALEAVASPLLMWGDRLRLTALALWAWSRAPDFWLPPARW